ncbi:RDD family protein [Clostridium sp. JN-9]|uniref:RDD family protein n=1 Tax=Clostridium sp. JN-9 TaxID=2507159 RepID=UPI000FFE0625|nr:RDD family protein [Clostridium sp. JN-9]QAT40681.1 hypothetical protein EQM05_10625 [Clostridium sp. JN-9]
MSENDNEKGTNEIEQAKPESSNKEQASENKEETMETSNDTEALESLSSIHSGNLRFSESFLAGLVDTAVNIAVSVILFYLLNFILKHTIGIYFPDKSAMILIFFTVISVLLPAIMETSKKKNTIGKKLSGLKTIRIK